MFRRIISDKDGKFIMSMFNSMRTGSFRLRVKLHKTPIKGRPIFNMTQSWLAPAAVYLVDVLQPLEKLLPHTVSSSSELMDLLEGEQILNPSARLVTFDIRNLYPSVDRQHFLVVFAKRVRAYWSANPSLALFIVKLTEFVLMSQHVKFQNELWKVDKGLPTGLQPSVLLANVYLAELDDLICQRCPCLRFWKRYIDDSFGILHGSSGDVVACKSMLDSWHPNIQWEISGEGTSVCYLDLDIQLTGGRLNFQTYRKPMNAYLYIPKISCHPDGVFSAMVIGETRRLYNQNKYHPDTLNHHLQFFLQKLQLRGHNRQQAANLVHRTVSKLQSRDVSTACKARKFFFRQLYTSTLDSRYVKRALHKHWHVVKTCLKSTVTPVSRSEFRRTLSGGIFATTGFTHHPARCRGWELGFLMHQKPVASVDLHVACLSRCTCASRMQSLVQHF